MVRVKVSFSRYQLGLGLDYCPGIQSAMAVTVRPFGSLFGCNILFVGLDWIRDL